MGRESAKREPLVGFAVILGAVQDPAPQNVPSVRPRVADRSDPSSGVALRAPSPGVNIAPGSDDDGWIETAPITLPDGTAVKLYKDGEVLRAAYDAIERAQRRIWLEVYIFHADETGWSFAELLAKRAREGLEVSVLYDSFGSIDTKRALFDMMRAAGVRVREFHPLLPWRAKHGWQLIRRDHRKLLVVDGELALLGGQNLGDEYGSSWVIGKSKSDAWRDTAAALRGPSVGLLSEAFARQWRYVEEGGPIERAELYHSCSSFADRPSGSLLAGEPKGCLPCMSLDAKPSVLDSDAECVTVLASVPSPRSVLLPALQKLLRDARSSIELTMAYFAPPDELVEQLCRSAREGLRVRLMLPGRSDVRLLRIAAHAFYERLLESGVEVYERQHAVLHAKSLCIDERMAIVGSTNLDYRSIELNCELSVAVHSKAFAAQVHALFEHDVLFARRIVRGEWRHRPRRDRLVQRAVLLVRRWL